MPLFGSKTKHPTELFKILASNLTVLENEIPESKKFIKAVDEISKVVVSMKTLLIGSVDQEPQTDVVAQLSQEFYNGTILVHCLLQLHWFDFEIKKDFTVIFNNLLRRQIGTRQPTVEHLCANKDILIILLKSYENPDIALNTGMMLRQTVHYEPLVKIAINAPEFFNFFEYIELPVFDVASEAFSTFKEILTRHKQVAAQFLEDNYEQFFLFYDKLLNSDNYVTKRQSLKLLGELLLERHNYSVMTKYISNPDNLKLVMTFLRDKSKNIQYEAFHVFKVFVANPNKTTNILDIFLKNKDRLVEFLSNFQTDRTDDEQFIDEKTYLIKQIRELHR